MIKIRNAVLDDFEFFYKLKCEETNIYWTGHRGKHLYIIPRGEYFELATAICQKYQGRGYAKKAIALGLDQGKQMGYQKMKDAIREDNTASLKAYQSCGVKITDEYKMVYIPKLDKEIKMYVVEKDLY